jgi:hypothetical protein
MRYAPGSIHMPLTRTVAVTSPKSVRNVRFRCTEPAKSGGSAWLLADVTLAAASTVSAGRQDLALPVRRTNVARLDDQRRALSHPSTTSEAACWCHHVAPHRHNCGWPSRERSTCERPTIHLCRTSNCHLGVTRFKARPIAPTTRRAADGRGDRTARPGAECQVPAWRRGAVTVRPLGEAGGYESSGPILRIGRLGRSSAASATRRAATSSARTRNLSSRCRATGMPARSAVRRPVPP